MAIRCIGAIRSILVLTSALLIIAPINVQGQTYQITNVLDSTCTGALFDSGGQGGPGYSNNENYTYTICPDVPGDVIYLTWITFNLDVTGPNPVDRLTIYDGNSTSATSLGTYTGTQLQGLVSGGTGFNTTGCLTLVFQSNGNGTGIFAASISCDTPCDRPTASAVMSEPAPAKICIGETLSFDGSSSFAAPGFNLTQYTWDFGDGSVDSTTGPQVSHTFSDPGEHIVQLYLVDDNDCASANLVDLQVLVGTVPDFLGTSGDTSVCIGESVCLEGMVNPTTWTGLPDANFGSGVYLPDDVGLSFTSTITFTQFNPGQTLNSANDLQSICIDIEHSFMGDLVLQVICPNGQTMIMHQQGGSSTFLGDANDFDTNLNPVPGTCWTYCWSPTATNGTWVDNSTVGTTPNTVPTSQGTALAPGTYESVEPFSNLVGCPLNGDWTFQSTDLWALDNGFLCGWELNFNPAIIPPITTFTPSFGGACDSTWWSGPGIFSTSSDCDSICILQNTAGTYDYTYTAVDDHGCTFDTTITITVQPPLQVDAGPDQVICNGPVQLMAQVGGGTPNCDWTLELNDSFGDGWDGAFLTVLVNGTPTDYTIVNGAQSIFSLPVSTGDLVELVYTQGSFEIEHSYILYDDSGSVLFSDGPAPTPGSVFTGNVICGQGSSGLVFQWTPTTGLSDPTIANPTALVSVATMYSVTVYPAGQPGCAATDSMLVSVDPAADPGLDSAVVICANEPPFPLFSLLGGTPAAGGIWTDSLGNVMAGTFDPLNDAPGDYTYTVGSALGCTDSALVSIDVLPVNHPDCCGPIDAGPDTVLCDLDHLLAAQVSIPGAGTWSGPPGSVFADPASPSTLVTMPSTGTYTFYYTEDDGLLCLQTDSVEVTLTGPISISFQLEDAICYLACDGSAIATVQDGIAPNGFIHDWSGGVAPANSDTASGLCAGQYDLEVTDENGCTGQGSFTIGEPPLLTIDSSLVVDETCHDACNGILELVDAEAVLYSFDGGQTYAPSSMATDLCVGIYDVAIQSADGCVGSGQVSVNGPPPVLPSFSWTPVPANVNDPQVQFINTTQNADHYSWTFDELGGSSAFSPVFLFPEKFPGTYEVCLVAVQDPFDCTDTLCQMVEIEDVLFTYVPNSFTPDGDGVNDLFFMSSNIPDFLSFELLVFDRWGEVIFDTEDPYEGWNGSYGNSGDTPVQDGVYVWKIRLQQRTTGAIRELTGHVTLIR